MNDDFPEFTVDVLGPRKRRVLNSPRIFGVNIPPDFETDGASVPRFLWWVISPFGEAFPAAIVHDYRCEVTAFGNRKKQKAADKEFRRNLIASGVPTHRAWLAYWGVRLFDWTVRLWRKRR